MEGAPSPLLAVASCRNVPRVWATAEATAARPRLLEDALGPASDMLVPGSPRKLTRAELAFL